MLYISYHHHHHVTQSSHSILCISYICYSHTLLISPLMLPSCVQAEHAVQASCSLLLPVLRKHVESTACHVAALSCKPSIDNCCTCTKGRRPVCACLGWRSRR
jgi:hypothetical protein